jgi:myo-inositol-1(or 4)-monophosphatase
MNTELAVARAAAEAAGLAIRARWDQNIEVRHKGEIDLVTEADLVAEGIIVDRLRGAFPGDAVVAEEGGGHGGHGGRTWYVDPLDGTTNFSHGMPQFAVSIALADDQGLRLGVVHAPVYGFTFHAVRGEGAWLEGRRLRGGRARRLGDALLATGFPYDRQARPRHNVDRFGHLLGLCQGVRRAGSAALDLAFVAAGWFDGYWEDRLQPWDLAAGCLLVTEAGGTVTAFDGGPADFRSGAVVASNGAVHVELLRALAATVSGKAE